MKRTLMTFGNAFGLALYDKQQRVVTSTAAGGADRACAGQASRPRATPLRIVPPAPATSVARTEGIEHQAQAAATSKTEPPSALQVAAPQPADDPSLVPLDSATISQPHSTTRILSVPVLEGFSKAFRKWFQVPADAPSIADRIC